MFSMTADIRGPWSYLLWMAARQRRALALDCVWNMMWVGGQVLTPAAIGAAVNSGLIARDQAALVWWGLAVLGLGVVQAVSAMFVERLELVVRAGSGYQTVRLITRKACELGATVGRRVSAGDLVTVGVSDINLIGAALEVGARGVGGVHGFVVDAVLMLVASWEVGLLELIAVPMI